MTPSPQEERDRGRLALWRGAVAACLAVGLGASPGVPAARGQDDPIEDNFRAGRYGEAATSLQETGETGLAALYWQFLLETDPDRALGLLTALRREPGLPVEFTIQLALQEAEIQFARGRFNEVLKALNHLHAEGSEALPGRVHILVGLSHWALQRIQESREAFATVHQSDPDFPLARYYLGRIGLASGDVPLALRYFDSAARSDLAPRLPALQAGTWEGLQRSGRWEEAASLRSRLLANHPRSLAVIPLQAESEPEVAPDSLVVSPEPAGGETGAPVPEAAGRFTLQLAAFADRSRALVFLNRWQDEFLDLRLEEEPGEDGRPLYKIRTGRFASRSQARTEAQRLDRVHGLKTVVVETDG